MTASTVEGSPDIELEAEELWQLDLIESPKLTCHCQERLVVDE